MKIRWNVLITCIAIVYGIGLLSSAFVSVDSDWYSSVKPSITPPDFIFPIVWNVLYFLMALALYFSWISAKKEEKRVVASVYGINIFANGLWSVLFFGLQLESLAFLDLIVIWLSTFAMISVSWKIDRRASYLLIPYLLWVTFAGVLNWMILQDFVIYAGV